MTASVPVNIKPAMSISQSRRFSTLEQQERDDSDEQSAESPFATNTVGAYRPHADVLNDFLAVKNGEVTAETRAKCNDLMYEVCRGAHRSYDIAKQIFEFMKENGIADSKSYSYLLMTVRRSLLVHELRFLFGEPVEYLTTNEELGQKDEYLTSPHFPYVCELLEEMKKAGYERPDPIFFDDLATALSAGKQAGVLINICAALEKRGVIPSIQFYNALLIALPKKGYTKRAEVLYERLCLQGLANYQTHCIHLNSLCDDGQLKEAFEFYKTMEGRYPMDRVPHNILIHGLLKAGKSADAMRLYNEMKTSSNPAMKPDRATCSTFISHYFETGDLLGASEVMSDLKEWGYPRNSRDYSLLIKLNARYDPAEALRLLQEADGLGKLDGIIANDIIRVDVDKKIMSEWKNAIHDAFLKAVLKGEPVKTDGPLASMIPDRHIPMSTYGIAAHMYRNMVREILGVMEMKGWEPNCFTMEYILHRMVNQENFAKLPALEEYLKKNQVQTTYALRNYMIQAKVLSGRSEEEVNAILENTVRSRYFFFESTVRILRERNIPLPKGAQVSKFYKNPPKKTVQAE